MNVYIVLLFYYSTRVSIYMYVCIICNLFYCSTVLLLKQSLGIDLLASSFYIFLHPSCLPCTYSEKKARGLWNYIFLST